MEITYRNYFTLPIYDSLRPVSFTDYYQLLFGESGASAPWVVIVILISITELLKIRKLLSKMFYVNYKVYVVHSFKQSLST